MSKQGLSIAILMALTGSAGSNDLSACEEQDIPLASLPAHILAAAQASLAGIELTEAELINTQAGPIYEVEGLKDDKEYEIHLTQDGKLIKVELDD